jgi:hypothetical protein
MFVCWYVLKSAVQRVGAIKLFSSSQSFRQNKLERLSLVSFYQASLIFVSMAAADISGPT